MDGLLALLPDLMPDGHSVQNYITIEYLFDRLERIATLATDCYQFLNDLG